MLDKVEAAPDTPAVKYERLLQSSIRLQREFNTESDAIAVLFRMQEPEEAEERATAHRDMAKLIDRLTRERLGLVRLIEQIPTGRDTVKQRQAEDAIATLLTAYDAVSTTSIEDTHDTNTDIFAVARERGYAIERDDEWIVLTKETTEIHLVIRPNPGPQTVGGDSRVAQIAVYDRAKGRRLVSFDGDWVQACVDPNVQKELDSLLAALA
jgi:hypothetical protein